MLTNSTDIAEQARELLPNMPEGTMRNLIIKLCDEVERLCGENKSFLKQIETANTEILEVQNCDKCDLCEDHHA